MNTQVVERKHSTNAGINERIHMMDGQTHGQSVKK